MSGSTPTENVPEHTEPAASSLAEALEDISQQVRAKMADLEHEQTQLGSLQTVLRDAEKSNEKAELELRAVTRRTSAMEEDLSRSRFQELLSLCKSAHGHTVALQHSIDEEDEEARRVLAGYNEHRKKMEGHRAALAESHRGPEEKLIRELKQRKEELRRELENSNGKAMQEAKTEKEQLKEQMAAMRNTVAARTEELNKEFDAHAQIKKDIEIQKRRYKAIVRHLYFQLNMAQAYHRRLSGDVHHMEKRVSTLRRQLDSP